MTSVDPEKCQGSWKYNENLKEFLKPTLMKINLNKNKYGKRIKTYAQVLGIEAESQEEKKRKIVNEKSTTSVQHNGNKSTKPNQQSESELNENLNEMIKGMTKQINELINLVQILVTTLVKDDEVKK